jgi:hypothetical protein
VANSEFLGLSLGVVLAKNNVNPGDAFCPEVESFNLLFGHANENLHQASIGLLLHEGCKFITQFIEFLRIEPTLSYHEFPFAEKYIHGLRIGLPASALGQKGANSNSPLIEIGFYALAGFSILNSAFFISCFFSSRSAKFRTCPELVEGVGMFISACSCP